MNPGGAGSAIASSARRASITGAAALLIGAVIAACGGSSGPRPAASSALVSPLDGIIVGVDATNISTVRGFTLRTAAGQLVQFTLGQLENPTQFPPGHLLEHEATSLPVRVYFAASGSTLLVYRLEDAPGSSARPVALPSFVLRSAAPMPSEGIGNPP